MRVKVDNKREGATPERDPDAPVQMDLIGGEAPKRVKRGKAARGGNLPSVLKALRRESGIGLPLLKKIERQHPRDAGRQLSEFLGKFTIPAGTGRRRAASIRTGEQYGEVLQKTLRDLALPEVNMRLQNLSELSRKHVQAVTNLWVERGASAAYLATLNTSLRRLAIWMGKPDCVPRLKDLIGDPAVYRRSYSALKSKNWDTAGIDISSVFEAMDTECPVTGLHLRLILVVGLRPREALMLKPSSADQGSHLFVTDGSKGGKARSVPVETPSQREILDRCKVVARQNARGVVSPRPNASLQRNIWRFYTLCRKVGICKKDLGVTPHGLRHTFANREYQRLTGEKSPVDGGGEVSSDVDHAARQRVSEDLGHSRTSITSAYLGTHRTLSRARTANMRKLLRILEGDSALQHVVREAGFEAVYVIGPPAEGRPVDRLIQLAFEVAPGPGHSHADAEAARMPAAGEVGRRVGQLLRCVCTCIPWSAFQGQRPETLELSGLTADRPPPVGAYPSAAVPLPDGTASA
jgi:integrase